MNIALTKSTDVKDQPKMLAFPDTGIHHGTNTAFFVQYPNSPLHWLSSYPTEFLRLGDYLGIGGDSVRVKAPLEQQVISNFSALPTVCAIYSARFGIERQFTVFVSASKFTDEILDPLLKKEYVLSGDSGEEIVSVTYIPGQGSLDMPLISPNAKLIFFRR